MDKVERFFKVSVDLANDWFKYKKNRDALRELYTEFAGRHGIKATKYYLHGKELHIVPAVTDIANMDRFLCQTKERGLRKFKAASKIGKDWADILKTNEMKVMYKPTPIIYTKHSPGRFWTQLFDIDGLVYCSIGGTRIKEYPKDWEEIKGSEYYAIIESKEKEDD